MTLIDIGNTTACVYKNEHLKRIELKDFSPSSFKEKVFYISVNANFSVLPSNFINLEPFFSLDTSYIGLGVDRIASCYYIDTGVIVDAGSAITVDLMKNKKHLGGFILPGIESYLNAYKNISCRLNYDLNTTLDLGSLPNSTKDAISYGIISSIVTCIKEFAKDETIYLTGGDSSFLNQFFKNAINEKNLVFQGMQKLIKDLNL